MASPTSRDRYRLRLEPLDVVWAIAAPFVALALRDPTLLAVGGAAGVVPQTYQYAIIAIVLSLCSFLFFRISDGISRFFSIRDAANLCAAVACAVALSSVAAFMLTRLEGVPRSTPLIHGLVLVTGLVATRLIARTMFQDHAHRPSASTSQASDYRRVLIVGVDHFAAAAIRLIDCQRPRTTIVVAALDGRPSIMGRKISGVKVVGNAADIDEIIQEYLVHGVAIDEVWVSDSAPLASDLADYVAARCRARSLPLLRLSEALNLQPQAAPTPVYDVEEMSDVGEYFEIKRIIDVIGASALLAALLPITAVVAALTYYDVGAPMLFWQQRVGRHGRKFLLYKFRTYHAPFDRTGRRIPEEQRLSRIGRLVRATRLDEIPQLYSVLVGDMSLIGPRPLLPHDQPKDPRTRLLVRPGITGWAQINGGTAIGPEEKDALDIWYIRHASFMLDMRIVFSTLMVALMGEKQNHIAVRHAMRWRQSSFAPSSVEGSGTGAAETPHGAVLDLERSVTERGAQYTPGMSRAVRRA
ncbi:sugar transferase [Methylocystis echinoides]|uniref:sugar transferase n=1 Tax=Methylocystis echinoides TaxID=29468 RepID=UPI00343DEF22